MEIEMRGQSLRFSVNGRNLQNVMLNQVRPPKNPAIGLSRYLGRIGFLKRKGEVRFRNIEIKELPPTNGQTQVVPGNPSAAPKEPKDQDFEQLFNGRDLTGWKTHATMPNNWRVEKGLLVNSGEGRLYSGGGLYSERSDYKDFHLRVELRVDDELNGGIHFRAPFDGAVGYRAFIDCRDAPTDGRSTGGLGPGQPHPILVSRDKSPVRAGDWFTMEIIAKGAHLVIKVNEETTADYQDDELLYANGHILLGKSGNGVIEIRKIEIKELPSKNPKNQAGDGHSAVPQKPPNPVAANNSAKPEGVPSVVAIWDGTFSDGNTAVAIWTSDHMIVVDKGFQGRWDQTGRKVVAIQTNARAGDSVGTWEGEIDQTGKTMSLTNQELRITVKSVRRPVKDPVPSVVGTWDATFSDGNTGVFIWNSNHKFVGPDGIQGRWDQTGRSVIAIQTFPLAGKAGPGCWEGEIDPTGKTVTWTNEKFGITGNYVRR